MDKATRVPLFLGRRASLLAGAGWPSVAPISTPRCRLCHCGPSWIPMSQSGRNIRNSVKNTRTNKKKNSLFSRKHLLKSSGLPEVRPKQRQTASAWGQTRSGSARGDGKRLPFLFWTICFQKAKSGLKLIHAHIGMADLPGDAERLGVGNQEPKGNLCSYLFIYF